MKVESARFDERREKKSTCKEAVVLVLVLGLYAAWLEWNIRTMRTEQAETPNYRRLHLLKERREKNRRKRSWWG